MVRVALDAAGKRPLAEAAVSGAAIRSAMPAPRIPARGATTPPLWRRCRPGRPTASLTCSPKRIRSPRSIWITADIRTPHSIDVWAQNFLDVARHTYAEVTPSGEGCRIWGLTGDDTDPVNRKFTLEIDGKQIAAELFRRTPKALTITGYRLDTIRELTNLDRAFDWAIVWGERRKAAAAEAAATQINGHGFNGGGPGHDIDHIEQIVREGARPAPTAATRFTRSSAITSAAAGASSRSTNTCSNSRTASPAATSARAGFPARSPGAPASTTIVRCRCSTAGRRLRLSRRGRRRPKGQIILSRHLHR